MQPQRTTHNIRFSYGAVQGSTFEKPSYDENGSRIYYQLPSRVDREEVPAMNPPPQQSGSFLLDGERQDAPVYKLESIPTANEDDFKAGCFSKALQGVKYESKDKPSSSFC